MSSPPQSLLDYYASVEQGSNRRFSQELAAQAKQSKAELDMRYKIAKLNAATEQDRIAVDRWYNEQQIRLAEMAFGENVRQFDKEFGLNEGDLTGFYGGNPTLARSKYESDLGLAVGQMTGMYNGQQTLEARELERRFGLDEGSLTGMYNGQQTLQAQELARRFGLDTQKFGLDVASTAAEMRSRPDMIFQYQQFQRDLPGLLQRQGGTPSSGIQGAPQGQTIQGQLAELGYLSAAMPQGGRTDITGGRPYNPATDPTPGGDTMPMMYAGGTPGTVDPTLAALGSVYQQGFDKMGAQTLEKMDENERGFLSSAGTYLGYDPSREMRKYLGSRLGQ